ncbi:uncharacterized protein LOC135940602 [Cloeon dipterum]|uniref:uncharacterized protein LOC135940602 n=1 Tax=Cloeon dipterum TaxID=197152 RepID=UPI00321F7AC4
MKSAGCTTAIVLFFAHAAFGADPVGGVCKGKITADRSVEPVYLRSTDYSVLKHVDGTYQVENGESVIVACPGSSKMFDILLTTDIKLEDGTNSFLATCNNGKINPSILGVQRVFEIGQWQCETELVVDAKTETKNAQCQETWIDSGFDAKYRATTNLTTIIRHTAVGTCYNERTKSVLFSKQIWSRGLSLGSSSSSSWDSIFLDKTDLDNLYKKHSDLDRGHLAPDTDFQNYALKKLTYYYHNAAPQLSAVNSSGVWRKLEGRMWGNRESAEVYTGTSDGEEQHASGQPEYLDNQRKLVRIPDFFWKLVFPGVDSYGLDGTPFGYVICNKERVRNTQTKKVLSKHPCDGQLQGGFCLYGDDTQLISNLFPEARVN